MEHALSATPEERLADFLKHRVARFWDAEHGCPGLPARTLACALRNDPTATMTVARDKLYDEVWAEPMTKVAARCGVSSSFLARVCDRLNVPRPLRGYWAQLQVGKAPARPVLPDARPGDELEWSRNGEPHRVPRAPPRPPEGTPQPRARPRTERPGHHELLEGARDHFDRAKASRSGYLRPWKRLLVDVFVSKDALARALDIANALFHALEDRGHRVVFAPRDEGYRRPDVDERAEGARGQYDYYRTTWSPDRPTVTFVGTVAIASRSSS